MRHDTLIERVHEIERVAEKYHLLETRILGVLNFRDFFQVLHEQIGDIFGVPHVWFSLIRDEEAAAPLQRAALSSKLRRYLNLVEPESFGKLIRRTDKPLLENENLAPYLMLLPESERFSFKSLAMVPVSINGTLVGSLNLADPSPRRFHPGYNAVHLERLAVKVSLFLSNVTAHENLQYLAYHDPLTELHNRRAMEQTLEREFSRAQRYNSQLSLAFIDLDLFKQVNDTYGHDCGDALLKYIAEGMTEMSRQSDMVTRLAGDEFVLLLPETGKAQATILLQRMSDLFAEQPMSWNGEEIAVRLSFGVASALEDTVDSAAGLMKLADERVYQKKRARRGDG
ncbi:diguanylate cyclase (GGDEF) domain-containing protein [Malonomonas rubra DSM 5091]|uniref:diguanylate cyclase n=1 Tax=Malonomonas rubra DSM 5091 TaxID=1122189 RepID=A0A1M6GMX0_MALRU|nr:GGDEF domain-containing protein [Malonomonas rubra]SHJ11263.1 diguanylate cyclase (GGDEF) domain-containing protein [Malonomonas rubra DSM 5091]